jgi:predicted TIM-barrel fold metal-dependent hydrolase
VIDDPLPLSFDPVSNGEYLPPVRSAREDLAEKTIRTIAEKNARRLGMTRRTFLTGACGMAATLATINQVYGARGGRYAITPQMLLEPEAAAQAVEGKEFIFDIQSHHIMPDGEWKEKNPGFATVLRAMEGGRRKQKDWLQGFSRYFYTKEIFLDSDTGVAVLSALPAVVGQNPMPDKDAAETRDILDRMGNCKRLLIHGLVTPNVTPLEEQLDGMEKLAGDRKIAAWKVYTPWGPDKKGFWLDDEKVGIPFIEKALKLGINVICCHKGIPLPFLPARAYELASDVGRVAKRFPEMNFIVYHSGYDPNKREGPYDPNAERGVDVLLRSLDDNGIKPNSNVYAEIGTSWWILMRRPEQAAHVLGKLLKRVGEDRVVWGTDSIWYGTPQPQIEAFRAFEMSKEFQEQYGYPALTKEIKAKVFGLNASRPYGIDPRAVREEMRKDEVEKLKQAYLERPMRTYLTYGPRTRREFFDLLGRHGGMPA